MIFVDTSVWVQALRRGASDEAGVLRTLLDADEVALPLPVRIELLSGVSAEQRPALTRALAALPEPPYVGRVFPFQEAPAALAWLKDGGSVGKVVLQAPAG